MFVVLGAVFLSASVPKVVDRIEVDLSLDVPLRRRERQNLDAVVFVSAALQVVFVSAAVWLFYVALGALLVSLDVRDSWLGVPGRPLVDVSFLGEPVVVTYELVRVANGVAAFAGLYYAVTILGDAEKRERFADALSEQLRDTFARRSEYHELLARDDDGTESGRGDDA
jgi:hypothetical protein